MDIKKDRWTENEVLALPSGEPDRFDRKSGMLLFESDFEEKFAKALSAFSNSGGGHLILGVKDDGTFDGVDKFHKGKTQTREWLEQKLPYLVTPVLQDFRVHEIEKSHETQIPEDKVVIVIDVGDSNLAPHQSNKDQYYYYRVGGHSKPASHRYLEFLWRRESYPGPRIASAWVYKVINPLSYIFTTELEYLVGRDWQYDRSHPDWSKGLERIHQKYHSGNYEQFYDLYPEIYELIEKHDETIVSFVENLEKYYLAIKNSPAMDEIFKFTSSLESLEKLKDEGYHHWNHKIQKCKTIDDFFGVMFSDLTNPQIVEVLTQYAINGHETVNNSSFAPLWNVHSSKFLSIYDAGCEEKTSFEAIRKNLVKLVESIIISLKRERNSLCLKYQIPFEEHPEIIIQNQVYDSSGFGKF